MSLSVRQLRVDFETALVFTRRAFDVSNPALVDAIAARLTGPAHRVLFVVEESVATPARLDEIARYVAHHRASLALVAPPLVVPGGEAVKNDPAFIERLYGVIDELRIDRHAFVVIVGGGALLDAVGFATATAHRGIRTVRMPTTTLSQGDSGVGVKCGVNRLGKKNFVGAFAPPWAVVNDLELLRTLPLRERRAGLAEAVKVALLRDAAFFGFLRERASLGTAEVLTDEALVELGVVVERSASLHARHIFEGGDPFERGSARPLDFGHWAAHKLESLSAHRVRHGEAVALGIALDTAYAAEVGMLHGAARDDVLDVLRRLGFSLWEPELDLRVEGRRVLFDGIDEFREHLGGVLTLTLLRGIGHSAEVHSVDLEAMERALAWLRP